jgi:purine-nucleoside phosphorylase
MLDLSPCLINPQKGRFEPDIDPLALLVPLPGDLQGLNREFEKFGPPFFKNDLLRVFRLNDPPRSIALAGPAMGAPQMVMILEKLIALGARKILFWGWAGGIDPNLTFGDIILPDRAVSEEGTSRHYSDETQSLPSSQFLEEIKTGLDKEGLLFHQGPVWTTDAPYRETINKVKAFQSQGVLGVDMETSALFTVSTFRGVEAVALLIVSDDLSQLSWRHGFRNPRFLEARKQALKFIFKFIVQPTGEYGY